MARTSSRDTVHPRSALSNVAPPGEAADLPDPLQTLIAQAVDARATDVHLDVGAAGAIVRLRVDGKVQPYEHVQTEDAMRVVNQVKVAAGLGADAVNSPEEGQFHWSRGDQARDVRVTLVPTAPDSEAAHLRLLQAEQDLLSMDDLGFTDEQRRLVDTALATGTGLVLVGGPTGSGKTTTLYALAKSQNVNERIAASIEDPAEFDLPSVRQLEVDERHGLTMREGLRTLLRMDPDLLLVGEVRDEDSAVIAAQAALAGRMVLATVHGRDAAAAIDTLRYLDVPAYVLSGALTLAIAQALVRQLCRECRKQRAIEPHERELFQQQGLEAPNKVWEAVGCDHCGQRGYHGRTGVFEVVAIDQDLQHWLLEGPSQVEMRQRFADAGHASIARNVMQRVGDGVTSVNEAAQLLLQMRRPGR